jgi:hypothetical protein
MEPFDRFWQWADKPLDNSLLTIPAELHRAVMGLPPDDRRKRSTTLQRARSMIACEVRKF